MVTWRKTEGMNPKTSATPPKKTPKSYETHPGQSKLNSSVPSGSRAKGTRKQGLGMKNPDGRAKM